MGIMDLLAAPWFWLVIGFGFLLLELLAPGTILLWFGIGGILTAALAWLIPGDLPMINLLLFSLASLAGLIVGRNLWKRYLSGSEDSDLNDRGATMVGSIVEVHREVRAGVTGSVKVGDTVWRAKSDQSFDVGSFGKIIDVESTTVILGKADAA